MNWQGNEADEAVRLVKGRIDGSALLTAYIKGGWHRGAPKGAQAASYPLGRIEVLSETPERFALGNGMDQTDVLIQTTVTVKNKAASDAEEAKKELAARLEDYQATLPDGRRFTVWLERGFPELLENEGTDYYWRVGHIWRVMVD